MTDQADILAAQLAPYRRTPGILAALLVSHDGFVVAADADPEFKIDAVAAQVAGVIDIGTAPWPPHASRTAGEPVTFTISALSRSTTARGVLAGAMMPSQIVAS